MLPKFLSRRRALVSLALTAVAVGTGAGLSIGKLRAGRARAQTIYAEPLARPEGPLNVYHLGHSLVGRDMPAMVRQVSEAGHAYASQLGWGTSLREHWEPDLPVNGFDSENAHDKFRPARAAIASGDYDAVILTEMVEIADAVRYHDSADYLSRWAQAAYKANPATRIYLYETWHHTNDPAGWLHRIDTDWDRFWRKRILLPALAKTSAPIHVIPAGQVMAAFMRRVQGAGGIGGITRVEDLFATRDDGTPDTIHLNDLGAYLVALTHFAVLYHRSPRGLPQALRRADGSPADAPSAAAARAMQEVVWQVVTGLRQTGVAP